MNAGGRSAIRALSAVAAAAGAVIVLLATARYGPGLSPDGAVYLSVAESLAAGGGWRLFDGSPYLLWAPLWPGLLALAAGAGLDPLVAARLLEAGGFAATGYLGVRWMAHRSSSPLLVGGVAAALVLTPGLARTASHLWTEALYLAVLLGFFLQLDRVRGRAGAGALVGAALLAAGAALLRYAGVAVILTGVVHLALERGRPGGARLARTLGFALLSLSPLGLWLARNALVEGSALGSRAPAGDPWYEAALHVARVASGWLLPLAVPAVSRVLAALALAGLALVLAVRVLRAADRPSAAAPDGIAPVATAGLFHLAITLAASSTVALEAINERYLAPVQLCAVLLAGAGLEAVRRTAGRRPATAARVLFGVVVLVVALGVVRTGRYVLHAYEHGAGGYATRTWRESPFVRALADTSFGGLVYANAPDAYYGLTGRGARMSPRRHVYRSPQTPTRDLERFGATVASDTAVVLVWFDGVERPFLYERVELERRFRLAPRIVRGEHGAYRVLPARTGKAAKP